MFWFDNSYPINPKFAKIFRWKALDFASLKRSSVSFFNTEKSETAASKWTRAMTRLAKVFDECPA